MTNQPIQQPDKIQQAPDALGKPPSRLSPFKGARANMTSSEIFATTPKRIFNSKTQSVDRHGFGKLVGDPFGGNTETNEITFGTLKRLAPSNMNSKLRTPSRMVKGRTRTLPNSEQPSRTGRPSLNINGKDVNTNLLGKFNSQNEIKPCLKMKGSSPEKPKDQNNDSDNDLTTSLNTMKNAENAKSVKAFLQSGDDAEVTQPRKKRRAVTFTSELNKIDESPGKDEDLQKMLKMVLENQRVIMNKLNQIEERLS